MRNNLKTSTVRCLLMSVVLSIAGYVCPGCGADDETISEEIILEDENSDQITEDSEPAGEGTEGKIYVYVCGAVNAPGVYELDRDARVYEAVELAGGMSGDADPESVNQARMMEDGEQIRILTESETAAHAGGVGEDGITGETDGKVNINTAGKEELMSLTGIGEAKAQSILDYREEHGSFRSAEELMEIEGIKEGVFNKIKDDITI